MPIPISVRIHETRIYVLLRVERSPCPLSWQTWHVTVGYLYLDPSMTFIYIDSVSLVAETGDKESYKMTLVDRPQPPQDKTDP